MNGTTVRSTISNPTRTRILACLGTGAKTVQELCLVCRLSQSAVSQHLMRLRSAGAVVSERNGRNRIYRASDRRLVALCRSVIRLTEKR